MIELHVKRYAIIERGNLKCDRFPMLRSSSLSSGKLQRGLFWKYKMHIYRMGWKYFFFRFLWNRKTEIHVFNETVSLDTYLHLTWKLPFDGRNSLLICEQWTMCKFQPMCSVFNTGKILLPVKFEAYAEEKAHRAFSGNLEHTNPHFLIW